MNRFVAKLARGAARLAFWRKPATAVAEPAGDADAASEASSAAVAAPRPRLAWLNRIRQLLRRAPKADEPVAATESATPAPVVVSQPADADIEENSDIASRKARLLALLSSKRVWIPAVSVVVLSVIASMAVMLLKSNQEKGQLQAKLTETQKELKQKAVEAPPAPVQPPPLLEAATHTDNISSPEEAKNPPAADPVPEMVARAPARNPAKAGECDLSSKEDVSANLKDCIDAFNGLTSR